MKMRLLVMAALVAPLACPQDAPTPAQQAALIASVRHKALDYSQGLSDFLCTQITRRYAAPKATGDPDWKLEDTLTIRVSYFKQHEDYRVIRINEKAVNKTLDKVGGHQTRGEFGSSLNHVMGDSDPETFAWQRWSTMNGKPTAVFSVHIPAAHSTFQTLIRRTLGSKTCRWGVEGEIEVDRETQQALKLSLHSIEVPATCGMKRVEETIVHGNARIGDAEFLLPLHSESRIDINGQRVKAETDFQDYRKFSAETDIKFETPAAP